MTRGSTPVFRGRDGRSPWIVVAGLAVCATAAVVWAWRSGNDRRGAGASAPTVVGTPDISRLPPHEQFVRLADQVGSAMEVHDTAAIVRLFPVAEAAYTRLTPADRDIDARFHLAVLRARIGHVPGASAEVDSIVAVAPTHLFAYYLRAIIADYQGDTAAARKARQGFRAHYPSELATRRPEYLAHRHLLDEFLATTPPAPH